MKKKTIFGQLISVFIKTVAIFFVIIAASGSTYLYIDSQRLHSENESSEKNKKESQKKELKIVEGKKVITVVAFGVDKEGYRTDTIMLTFVNIETKKVNIISIPRDTYIELPEDIYNELKEKRSDTPSKLRINGVPAFAPKDERYEYSARTIEELLDIDIDYYVTINTKCFIEAVDLIGGVEFDVPTRMKYSDPLQDLYVDIYPGLQVLNGEDAEGVVRMRKCYDDKSDISRIKTQQSFMKEFFKQALSSNKVLDIVKSASDDIETDLNTTDILKFATSLMDGMQSDNLEMVTLPGKTDGNYYEFDYMESLKLFDGIMNGKTIKEIQQEEIEQIEEIEEIEEIPSTNKNIQILNSAKITGLASKFKGKFEEKGLRVLEIGNYTNEVLQKTKIIVKEEGMGKDLVQFFNEPIIEVDPTNLGDYDIIVIVGIDE